MKLKRMWPAYCIWVLFIIFDVVMVASSSFFLGLFPSDKKVMYTTVLTILGILLMSVLMIFFGKLYDSIEKGIESHTVLSNVIYGLLLGIITISAFIYRMRVLSTGVIETTGKLSLYENAMIGGNNITIENDLLSIIYTTLLRGILFFTGNDIHVALFFEIVSFCIFIVFASLSAKLLLGNLASVVFAAYVAFMPIFVDRFRIPTLGTDNLFYAMFSIELLMVALLIRGTYCGKYNSKAWIIWYLIVGVCVGFMGYADAGTFITVAPLLLAILFLVGREFKQELFTLLFVLLGTFISFVGMIIQEQGLMMADVTFVHWVTYYFKNLNTFSLFMIYTDYKIIYLITVIIMSGIIIGFWKNRRIDRVTPWLLSMLIIYVTVPFMGATKMNSQIMVTIFYGFMLACVASLITISPEDDGMVCGDESDDIEEASDTDSDETQEVPEEKNEAVKEIVKPETEDVVKDMVGSKEANKEDIKEDIKEDNKEEIRYVPEGMVLPQETEADLEERTEAPRMKMPKFEGTISIDRKEINEALKDDFDIPFTPGDDFDF